MTISERPPSQPVPHRALRVRRVRFAHPAGALRRHYADGDLIMSHTVAVLSATFPPGEDFFVRSVRHYRDRITDPELAAQVRGFIGQEVVHSREHDHLNKALRDLGYRTDWTHRFIEHALAVADRTLPPRVRLAFTAGLEHYTATIAEQLLTSRRAQAMLGDNQAGRILLWHALEESEHKAVAFDVYRAVGGSERLRIWSMRVISALLLLHVVLATTLSVLGDRATYTPFRLPRSLARIPRSPFLARDVIRRLRAYNRPGFHPDDFDNTALLERWRTELFGPEGTLVAHANYRDAPEPPSGD
ncbi:putative metal-dependent hydrolase [Actinomadura rubteroloni]|uniref:Putative metal-dependent hydrolase n=1 Tax=Actinomadura rubteroloni TaxID=1926885 RepID=A0A2P4UFM4_9ACTN|nr:metal-dependent hydrolase [Actinomadura rubteroloni]POM23835.1 putative metal-dependent hydrolase [Actinomadura rubteroloni]